MELFWAILEGRVGFIGVAASKLDKVGQNGEVYGPVGTFREDRKIVGYKVEGRPAPSNNAAIATLPRMPNTMDIMSKMVALPSAAGIERHG
jgi:hypothetical protein